MRYQTRAAFMRVGDVIVAVDDVFIIERIEKIERVSSRNYYNESGHRRRYQNIEQLTIIRKTK